MLIKTSSLLVFLVIAIAPGLVARAEETNGPGDFLKSLTPTHVFDDSKGAGLVVFPYAQQLQNNRVFLGQSIGDSIELTQLRITGGLDGPSGSAGKSFAREFKTPKNVTGTLFFAPEGVYVLSEGKTNFFASKPEQIPIFAGGVKAGQVKVNLLSPVRQGAYVFYLKSEDIYVVLDVAQGESLSDHEVFVGKKGALSLIGTGKGDQARDGSGKIFVTGWGTLVIHSIFDRNAQWIKPTGAVVETEIVAQGTSSAQRAIELGLPPARFEGEATPASICSALLGL